MQSPSILALPNFISAQVLVSYAAGHFRLGVIHPRKIDKQIDVLLSKKESRMEPNKKKNTNTENVYIFLFDGFSDWEIAYLTPELKKAKK